MSATAMAPLVFNAVPIFADVEPDCFCLDPESVAGRITPFTRAVFVVDVFGLPYDVEKINSLARAHGLRVVEDAAQAPGATWQNRYAGALADVGVYSLNYHKHIHCGEGGIVATDDDELAERARLIRNHAEAVVEAKGVRSLGNMIGFNFRMTEIEAAIARCQLRKLPRLLGERRANCEYLNARIGRIPAIRPPVIRENCVHAFYVQPLTYDEEIAGVPRDVFLAAAKAELPLTELREDEGVLINAGYLKPIYLQPMFQQRLAYGTKGCPFVKPWYHGETDYGKGLCPTAERLHEKEFFCHHFVYPGLSESDLDDVLAAFDKVWTLRKEL